MKVEPPECLGILVCDDIFRDQATNKQVIVGTFNNIGVTEFPYVHPRMKVLFTLTNGQGTYDLALSIEHEKMGKTLHQLKGPLTMEDPLAITDFEVELRGVTFPEEGKYWISLKVDDAIVMQRPINVQTPKEAKP